MLVGAEGTLGILTKATLKLIPLPESVATLLAFFRASEQGARAVAGMVEERITPCAMELMDRTAIDCVREIIDLPVPEGAGWPLLIEVDGPAASVAQEAERGEGAGRR